jgi:molybdopterin converting factor small subunit
LVSAVAVNGEAAGDVLLHDGDQVRFFPPSAGG